ncbi:MAG: hypothetical protein WDN24_07780 [Sphingomonas sp.]
MPTSAAATRPGTTRRSSSAPIARLTASIAFRWCWREATAIRLPLRSSALLDRHELPCGQGPFLVDCGSVGVGVTVGGGKTQYWVGRKRAN